jgi:hypothetical protein
MIQHMVRAHGLDPTRVFVTGLSAGGAMTSVLLATYPETFAAGAVVAGVPFGIAGNVHEAFAAMRDGARLGGKELGALVAQAAPAPPRLPRLAIWHGQADATVASRNAQALAHQWAAVHGLADQPDEVLARSGWTRSVWCAPDGETLIEMNLLAGLGHGTPVAAGGEDPIGQVAPFILEAGVSSSLEIARFWGLAPPNQARRLRPGPSPARRPSSHEPRSAASARASWRRSPRTCPTTCRSDRKGARSGWPAGVSSATVGRRPPAVHRGTCGLPVPREEGSLPVPSPDIGGLQIARELPSACSATSVCASVLGQAHAATRTPEILGHWGLLGGVSSALTESRAGLWR